MKSRRECKGPYRTFEVFWPTLLIQLTRVFGLKLFFGSKEHLFGQLVYFWPKRFYFYFGRGGRFSKTSFIAPIDAEAESSKATTKDMRIRDPKFFSVLKNWRSNFFIFTPKRSYEVEILNMAKKVLKSGMVLSKTMICLLATFTVWHGRGNMRDQMYVCIFVEQMYFNFTD